MAKYILRRFLFSFFTLIGATAIVFGLSRVVGDPRDLFAQEGGYGVTEETYEHLTKMLNLDKPIYMQYFIWLGKVVRGDLGRSLLGQKDVSDLIGEKVLNTLELTIFSWILSTIIGIPLGVLSAVKRGSFWDYAGRSIALIGQAAPPFVIAIIGILVFAVQLGWLPAGSGESHLLKGFIRGITKGDFSLIPAFFTGGWKHYVLPVGTLGLAASASYLRLTRSSMLEILDSEYIKLARAKGVSEKDVIWKHALKNALIPPLTLAALIFVGFLTGTIIVETVFVWPGLGLLATTAVSENDFTVMTGSVLLFAVFYTVVIFLSDLTYGLVDPRIRYS
ncbi:MAG: ABC transporter permease subunit [Dehalococcoidales bacterium]|nr:ABC transporter permease subunit [Dehalococcoidales bacterium]